MLFSQLYIFDKYRDHVWEIQTNTVRQKWSLIRSAKPIDGYVRKWAKGICVSQSREGSAKGMQRFFLAKMKRCAKGYCLEK